MKSKFQTLQTNSDSALCENPIFRGLSGKDLADAKEFFSLYEKSYLKDELIKMPGDSMTSFGIVIHGSVIVYMEDSDGNQIIMANVLSSEAFGEALCFLEASDISIYIRAFSDCRIAWLSTDNIKKRGALQNPLFVSLNTRYISMLSERMLAMNDRIQILSKSSLRQKLLTFFSQCERKSGKNTFDTAMSRHDLSVYLGVDRSALSRELSKMRKEGILEFYKSSFKLLK